MFSIIGLYTTFVFLASRVLRGFFSGIYTKIMFDDLPNVDRVLQLCLDIYLVCNLTPPHTSHHPTPTLITSHHLTLPHITPYHLTPSYITPHHLTSYNLTPTLITSHNILIGHKTIKMFTSCVLIITSYQTNTIRSLSQS